jgi:penicillin-binding protein 2
MALPAGSVFKPLTAVALLENGFSASQTIECRGYFQHPDAMRCAIFKRLGVGHGEIGLSEALVQSCNVYFFHAAAEIGPAPLVDWARRFGFGRPTNIDLPGEVSGAVPNIMAGSSGAGWRMADTQALAIGQSSLTVTPLQVARFMAALANGGRLVTPHVAEGWGLAEAMAIETPSAGDELDIPLPQPIPGLTLSTLERLRDSLTRVVADKQGTAHDTVYTKSVSIAGKTGTAETGGGRADHAWFAGYAPAEGGRVAFAVALEHAGDGATAAGPVARRLVEQMHELGYFRQRQPKLD